MGWVGLGWVVCGLGWVGLGWVGLRGGALRPGATNVVMVLVLVMVGIERSGGYGRRAMVVVTTGGVGAHTYAPAPPAVAFSTASMVGSRPSALCSEVC